MSVTFGKLDVRTFKHARHRMSKYKHLLFDLDGTLVDTFEANLTSVIELLDRNKPGHGMSRDDFIKFFGLSGPTCLRKLGVNESDIDAYMAEWINLVRAKSHMYKLFNGVVPVMECLKFRGYHMSVVTSRTRGITLGGPLGGDMPDPLRQFLDMSICANDVPNPKPAPDSLLHYMKVTGAKPEEILFIGDAATDLQCADAAGVDFALALWDYRGNDHLYCKHYLKTPWDLVSVVTQKEAETDLGAQMHKWAREINAIGQIGLTFSQDRFDQERYSRLQDIAAQMAACYVGVDEKIIRKEWTMSGYKTPQLDTRAAIFDDQDRILLVKEALSGKWNMPGGWCDENMTIMKNVVKEVKEEAGMDVHPIRLIAIHDKSRHNDKECLTGTLKAFVECSAGPGEFVPNAETVERRFFSLNELPVKDLRTSTNTLEQIMMCFSCHKDPLWRAVVE